MFRRRTSSTAAGTLSTLDTETVDRGSARTPVGDVLPRILTPLETWGFGMSGHIVWIISAPAVFQQLGMASMYTWLPLSITAMISCFQVRRLALQFPDVAGGVPSYIYRLFPKYKLFSTYAALGWFIGWVMAFTVYGIIIVEALQSVFSMVGIDWMYTWLVLGFSLIGFVVGFSSPRALSILHLLFVVPTMGLLLLFSIYGLFWLALSPASPGFWPEAWPEFEFSPWLLATFLGTYNIITMETEAVFAADSTNPQRTLSFLPCSAMLVAPIFLGGSYVLARLGSAETNGTTFEILNSVNTTIFGGNGTLVTLATVVLCCLLSSASGVAIAPRVLYQLGRDGLLNERFASLNDNGVAVCSLLLCLVITLLSVWLGGVEVIFFSAGLSYLLTYAVLNLGIWYARDGVGGFVFPRVSLGIGLFYAVLLLGGGWLAGWEFLVAGFLLPAVPILVSKVLDTGLVGRMWIPRPKVFSHQNFVLNQIGTAVFVVGVTVAATVVSTRAVTEVSQQLLTYVGLIGFLVLSFCSVAIASWTALPQLGLIERTRESLAQANKQLEQDIETRTRLQNTLQRTLRKDQLTGLGNRLSLEERLHDHLEKGREGECALVFVDLDRFKLVNDSLGHDIGDKLLKAVGRRLRRVVRRRGQVVRLGGDEFVVFLPRARGERAEEVAAKIVERFREVFVIDGLELLTTTSVGVVLGSSRYTQAADIVRDADVAMYRSKLSGRNKYTLFTDEMYLETVQVRKTEELIRWALQEGRVRVCYQPVVRLSDTTVVGVEALVRIEREDGQIVLPHEFIEVAEDSGLIVALTEQVLREVCGQQRAWIDQGLEIYAAVNLGDRTLRQVDLVEQITTRLAEYDLPAHALHIEILESAVMTETAVVQRNLEELAALGVMVAVDDFGTGYSNLSRLRELPITTLKIDRSFVVAMRERGLEIIQTIGQLAEVLGLRPLVEGVETEAELVMLKETPCEYAQGYYFCRPVPADGVERYIREQNGL